MTRLGPRPSNCSKRRRKADQRSPGAIFPDSVVATPCFFSCGNQAWHCSCSGTLLQCAIALPPKMTLAGVAELADAPDSKSGAPRGHGGSTPPSSTKNLLNLGNFCLNDPPLPNSAGASFGVSWTLRKAVHRFPEMSRCKVGIPARHSDSFVPH